LGKRLPWLVALLLLQSFSAAILHAFDELLERNIVIAVFIPMLVGTGGNAGNQPGVMVTRALSMGSIPIKPLLKREFLLACITAALLSTLGFLRVLAEYPKDAESAFVIALALAVVILISVFLGIGFSIGLDKLKRCDPADGAAPLLTTISDLIGISCLCLISYIFLD
jgi:magnesium transporter